jgi:hypothetical protein
MEAFIYPVDEPFTSRKRTLDAFLATERWVRATRRRLQEDLYGAFSFFSTLPLELLYCILGHLLRHDVANPTAPCATLGLLSTCKDARALLPAWCAHTHRTMGAIPTQQELSFQFYMKALGRLLRGQFRGAGCHMPGVLRTCRSADLIFLQEHHYTEAMEWLVETSHLPMDAISALMTLAEKVPGEHRFAVQHATRVAANNVDALCRYLINWCWSYKHNLLEGVAESVLSNTDAWVKAFNLIATTTFTLTLHNFAKMLLRMYRVGWLQSWEGLPAYIDSELAWIIVRHAPALLRLPFSATDASPNPLVRQHLLVCATAAEWEQLNLQGMTYTLEPSQVLHWRSTCARVGVPERLRRLHARGCVIVPNGWSLFDCIEDVVACAHVFAWPHGPTAEDLTQMARLKGDRCKAMARLHGLCGGAGDWAGFVAHIKDSALKRKLAPLLLNNTQ